MFEFLSLKSSLSIKSKLAVMISGLIALISLFIFFYFPAQQEKQALKAIVAKAESITHIMAYGVSPALYFNDKDAIEEVIESASQNEDIAYLVLINNADDTVSFYRNSEIFCPDYPDIDGEGYSICDGGDLLGAITYVEYRGQVLARLILGVSLTKMRSEVGESRATIALISFIILILGIIIVLVFSNIITKPLRIMTDTVKKIAKGDLTTRVDVTSNDEVGLLGHSFNEMVNNLEATQQQFIDLNRDLEKIVRDRTSNLQKEILEKSIAEEALKDSEQRLSLHIQQTPLGVIEWNLDFEVTEWNKSAEKIFGFTKEEALGRHPAGFIVPEHVKEIIDQIWVDLIAQKGGNRSTNENNTKDNRTIICDWYNTPLVNNNGNVIGVASLVHDITEQKNAEEALKAGKEAAEEANKAKSEFLANVSHEIRTPMNGIIGMTDLTLDTDLTEEQKEYLNMVKTSADNLLNVINDILDFSKIEAGKLKLENINFSLRDVIESTMESFTSRAHNNSLELITFIAPLVPDLVIGDPGRLKQIIVNLIGNAIKFTNEGQIVLNIEIEGDLDPPRFHFTIADTGVGISEDRQKAIFESFTQADGSTTRVYGGTGLGTTISRQFVEMMNGKIWVESPVNESGIGGPGSAFHFHIRIKVQKDEKPHVVFEKTDLTGKRILIVDDNKINRLLFSTLLENWDMKPEAAPGSMEAMQIMKTAREEGRPYDLILLDVMMPDMDGFVFVKKITEKGWLNDSKIIMLSSGHIPGDGERAKALGVSAYLSKPIKQSGLYNAIFETLCENSAENSVRIFEPPRKEDKNDRKQKVRLNKKLAVLVVEDNHVNQALIKGLLLKRGYHVSIAENGKAAIETLERKNHDVILMDIQMPIMGGVEATKRIREKEKEKGGHIPIIALTAHALIGDSEMCLKAGMDYYLSKPVNPRKLFEILDVLAGVVKGADKKSNEETADINSVFNKAQLMDRVQGDTDLLNELVALFVDEYPGLIMALERAISERNIDGLKRSAHTLKGMVGNLGAIAAQDLALQLEILGGNGAFEKAESYLANLKKEIGKLKQSLIEYSQAI